MIPGLFWQPCIISSKPCSCRIELLVLKIQRVVVLPTYKFSETLATIRGVRVRYGLGCLSKVSLHNRCWCLEVACCFLLRIPAHFGLLTCMCLRQESFCLGCFRRPFPISRSIGNPALTALTFTTAGRSWAGRESSPPLGHVAESRRAEPLTLWTSTCNCFGGLLA